MDTLGFGDYSSGEIVYQGQSLELAYSSGVVKEWNNSSSYLVLSESCGSFKLNQPVIGTKSLTIKKALRFGTTPLPAFTANSVVSPYSANSNSYYTIETTITEAN